MTLPQGPELIIIVAVLVLLFGAKKLPELGSSVGKTITNFKKGLSEGKAEAEEDAPKDAVESSSDERGSGS